MSLDTTTIFRNNQTEYDQLKNEALAAMNRLESAARAQVYNSVQYQDPGDVHTPGKYEPIDVNSLPTVQEVMAKVNNITPDVFPTPPSADEVAKYKRHIWESDQLDKIESTIMAYISNMGMPSTEFQDAIFNENRERRQRALQDDIDLIKAATSARGFKYATGQTNALIADLIEKNQLDHENLNREITRLMTEWSRQNLQFGIQQGASIEESHMNFAHKYSIIYREIYTTQLNGILEKYRVGVMQEMSKLEGVVKIVAARSEVLRANTEIVGKEDSAWLQKNQLEINEALGRYSTAVQAMLGQATTEVNAANAYATVASHLVQGVSNNVLGITTSSSKSQ